MWNHGLGSLAVMVLLAGAAIAQVSSSTAPPAQTPSATRPAPAARSTGAQIDLRLDQHLAACLILDNHEEVVLGQFAAQRAENSEVKQFAQSMVNDHTRAIAKLEPFAPATLRRTMREQAQTGAAHPRSATESRAPAAPRSAEAIRSASASAAPSTTAPPAGESREVASPSILGTLFQIDQQATKNCIALTQQELSQKKGADFDKAYIGQQIVGHVAMLARLSAAEPYATGELRQLVQQLQPEVAKHLAHAKSIMKSQEK